MRPSFTLTTPHVRWPSTSTNTEGVANCYENVLFVLLHGDSSPTPTDEPGNADIGGGESKRGIDSIFYETAAIILVAAVMGLRVRSNGMTPQGSPDAIDRGQAAAIFAEF